MEFKNLAEVTQLEEVPEGASVLAATAEGEVVRVPGDGLGGGLGGADWDAAEGEAGYIANKPFYIGRKLTEIAGATLTTVVDQYAPDYAQNTELTDLIDNSVLTGKALIVFDGTEYECNRFEISRGGDHVCYGNMQIRFPDDEAFWVESNGEPFALDYWYGKWYLCTAEPGTHTISINNAQDAMRLVVVNIIPDFTAEEPTFTADKTFEQLYSLLEAGNNVVANMPFMGVAQCNMDWSNNTLVFSVMSIEGQEVYISSLSMASDDSITLNDAIILAVVAE